MQTADHFEMRSTLVAAAIVGLALLAPGSSSAHFGVPRAWWLDERTAVVRLREEIRPRYQPKPFRTFRGECRGRAPSAGDGAKLYKHFYCSFRMRANGIT